MKRINRYIKKLCFNYIPIFLKTGVTSRIPSLYSLMEIRPNSATINITDRCNLKCVMCRQWRRDSAEELSTERWKGIIRDLKKNGINNIHFTGGEPLLRKDLADLVSYTTQNGFVTGITTNGLLLNKKNLAKLISANLNSIGISIDALEGDYDKLRGVPGTFSKVKDALFLLSEAKSKNEISAYINFTLMKDTVKKFKDVKNLADSLRIPVGVCLLDRHSFIFDLKENKKDFWISEESSFSELAGLLNFFRKEKVRKPSSLLLNFSMIRLIEEYFKDPRQAAVPCVVSQDRIIVDPHGNLLGGCMSMGSFGNLAETPYGELVREKRYKTAKKNMFYKNCAGCSCGYQFNIQHTPRLVIQDFFQRIKHKVFKEKDSTHV